MHHLFNKSDWTLLSETSALVSGSCGLGLEIGRFFKESVKIAHNFSEEPGFSWFQENLPL